MCMRCHGVYCRTWVLQTKTAKAYIFAANSTVFSNHAAPRNTHLCHIGIKLENVAWNESPSFRILLLL
jgi:hypothetical protein